MYAAVLVLLLTQSRAGVVAACRVVALWLLLSGTSGSRRLRLVVAGRPGPRRRRLGVHAPGARRGRRCCGPIVSRRAGLRLRSRWRRARRRRDALACAGRAARARARASRALASSRSPCGLRRLVGSLGLVAAVGNPFGWASSELSGGECVNDPGRLTDLCANNRLAWWDEALEIAADRPLGGSGAGTFELARRRYRDDASPGERAAQRAAPAARRPRGSSGSGWACSPWPRRGRRHPPRASARRRARATGRRRARLPRPRVWHPRARRLRPRFPRGDCARARRARGAARGAAALRPRPRPACPGLVALAATTRPRVAAIALPALAERDIDRALDAADAGRIDEAVDAAERARRLDPLSPGPLLALAVAADAAGTRRPPSRGTRRRPTSSPRTRTLWFELGLYHVIATGDLCAAYQALNHSYTLDPNSRRWVWRPARRRARRRQRRRLRALGALRRRG